MYWDWHTMKEYWHSMQEFQHITEKSWYNIHWYWQVTHKKLPCNIQTWYDLKKWNLRHAYLHSPHNCFQTALNKLCSFFLGFKIKGIIHVVYIGIIYWHCILYLFLLLYRPKSPLENLLDLTIFMDFLQNIINHFNNESGHVTVRPNNLSGSRTDTEWYVSHVKYTVSVYI